MSAGRDTAGLAVAWPDAWVDAAGRFVFRYRDYLVPAAVLAAMLFARPQAPFGSEAFNV